MNNISQVLFIGSKQLGLTVLREIHKLSPNTLIGALTINDTDETRSVFGEYQQFSKQKNLALYVAENRKESEEIIHKLKPDLCLVVGWYWLISKKTLDSTPFGFIGIHNSLLPKYRGGSPLIWPILRNEKRVGFSFFSFTEGMDDGDIWAQGSVDVDHQDYISDILNKLEDKTIQVLQNIYPKVLSRSIQPIAQEHEAATFCAQRLPGDGKINWDTPALDVYNFIRAQSAPYPGAFTYVEGQTLKIWRAKIFDKPYDGTPGQVAKISDEGVFVICGDNRAIIIEEAELSGKRGIARDLIISIKIRMQ